MTKPEKEEVRNRVRMLRDDMRQNGIDILVLSSTDPHASEYVPEYYKVTEYFSGCTSDNAVLVIEDNAARLWTDGRYFISAASELEGTGIALMKMRQPSVPTVTDYLRTNLVKNMKLGFDGRCVKASFGMELRKIADSNGAEVVSTYAPADHLWVGRPALPVKEAYVLGEELIGTPFSDKLARVRARVSEFGASYHVLSKLDDIMWLFNIRGSDVPCNPVALSFALIGPDTVDLFIRKEAVSPATERYFRENRVKLHSYESVYTYLEEYHFEGSVLADSSDSSDAICALIKEKTTVIDGRNPTLYLKGEKDAVEIGHIRRVYVEDSAAVCRFIYSIKQKAGKEKFTEYTAARKIDGLRRCIPGFLDISFPTISAYGPNAAMPHYAMTQDDCSVVSPDGFLLVDSGGQYMGGTTDVTRTIVVGPLTDEMKRDFTLVAAANLRLMYSKFPEGTTGIQLDMLAREVLFEHGLDYDHGTGHGIGFILNVHEGPHSLSRSVKPGSASLEGIRRNMIVSDEPGVYREGRYGIRTESILLCEDDETTEFGHFLKFAPLTFAPIDLDAIDPRYLEPSDVKRLNRYHKEVRDVISPFLKGEELEWL
ncbi:MAG: aminopeptidase P family protein, partial [Lachnospiraceae bacterium]|nr:aminopeptidase P family protein [Lachnospiraceae bacterium]